MKASPTDLAAEEFYFHALDICQAGHDINIKHITAERYHSADEFVHACKKVGIARLKRGELSGNAGLYVAELADALAVCIEELIREGDAHLARRLPAVVERLSAAQKRYGMKLSAKFTEQNSIEVLLKKDTAKGLLAMVVAHEPDLEKVMHWLDWKVIHAMTEEQLCALLVRKAEIAQTDQPEPHPLAAYIVNFFNLGARNFERPNINLFVEHLWQGFLWSLREEPGQPGTTFEKCPWFGEQDKPQRANTKTWMKRIRGFLRERTQGDMSSLLVFEHLLARREAKFAKSGEGAQTRLRDDKATYALGVVMDEIEEAWKTMANRASGKKRKAKTTR